MNCDALIGRPGCYCKPGTIPHGGECIKEKFCPSRCTAENPFDCPKIAVTTYLQHAWLVRVKTGKILAVFKPLENAYKGINIVVHKDTSISVRQKNEIDQVNQFYFENDQDKISQLDFATFKSTTKVEPDGSYHSLKLTVENKSWLDVHLEWIDFEGNWIHYEKIGQISDQNSATQASKLEAAEDANFEPDSDQEIISQIVSASSPTQPRPVKIEQPVYVEEIIECQSIRNTPCQYDKHIVDLGHKIKIQVFTMQGGNFTQALVALKEDLLAFKHALKTVEDINRQYQVHLLSKLRIFMNDGIIFGKARRSTDWSGSVFHPGRTWLAENKNLVEKVGALEFYTVDDYLQRRTHHGLVNYVSNWQVVHELSHWYHWYLTNYGLSSIDVIWNARGGEIGIFIFLTFGRKDQQKFLGGRTFSPLFFRK